MNRTLLLGENKSSVASNFFGVVKFFTGVFLKLGRVEKSSLSFGKWVRPEWAKPIRCVDSMTLSEESIKVFSFFLTFLRGE